MDQRTIEVIGVPGVALMEVAGRGAAQALWSWWERKGIKGRRVVVFCGGGNNGGDGWVMGRHLKAWGCEVVGVLLVEESSLKGDALWAFKGAKASGVEVVELGGRGGGFGRGCWGGDGMRGWMRCLGRV